jgi:predicted GNAT family acetyltransferase
VGVHIDSTSSAADFLEGAGSFLEQREAAHCLTLGFAGAVRAQPELAAVTFRIARDGGRIVATTMGFQDSGDLTLSEVDDVRAIPALADAAGEEIREVHAPSEHADVFAATIGARIGRRLASPPHAAEQRIFELTQVVPPAGVPGSLRRVAEADRAIVVAWLAAFEAEAIGGDPVPDEAWFEALLTRPGRAAFLWEVDGRPVSMCTSGGLTAHGIRFGGVYTPPERRGHGYASACVAAASQHHLDAGRTRCFLLTDLANPTANHIYEAIGYRRVRDFAWRLLR